MEYSTHKNIDTKIEKEKKTVSRITLITFFLFTVSLRASVHARFPLFYGIYELEYKLSDNITIVHSTVHIIDFLVTYTAESYR